MSVILSMPESKASSISITIPFSPVALFLINLASADFTSDFNISGPSTFLYITGCSLSSWKSSPIYSFYLWGIFSFSNISLPSLVFIHPAGEHVFYPVSSLIFVLFISSLFVILILSIFAHISLSYSFLAYLHLFLISLCGVLYSVVCLGIVFSHPLFFFLCLFLVGMISIADVTKNSLNVSHFEFPFSFCPSHLLFTLSIYFSVRFVSFKNVVMQFGGRLDPLQLP